jgi:hypothetical protein
LYEFQQDLSLAFFLFQVILLLLGTIGCTIACSITIVIPVAMIVVGEFIATG